MTTFTRAIAAFTAGASFAACSNQTVLVPGARSYASSSAMTVGTHRRQPSPCRLPNGFFFRGPCKALTLSPYHSAKLAFPIYRGLTLTTTVFVPTAPVKGEPFVVGLGTSDADITGKIFGTVFPEYGTSGGCETPGGASVACQGKGFLYVLLYNPGSAYPVGMGLSPPFRIKNAHAFPGAKCQEALLLYSHAESKWIWEDLPVYATPHSGIAIFKPYQWILTLSPGQFDAVAFHCY